jgi:phenylpropionate dioxygenase-like ring-hydroxylating dioxygenase large terminal subunit
MTGSAGGATRGSTTVVPPAVHEGHVDSNIYRDPEVFALEMERIFHRWWVYVGHTSEVPNPGDYCLKTIGMQPVIMTQSADGAVRLLLNRCRHRASMVCQLPRGNSSVFRCQYHGWTYENDGRLIGVPRPDGYGPAFDKSKYGLDQVPRIGVHRGFVFASLATDGIPFEDYIGPAAPYIDAFCDASPLGEIYLGAGVQKTAFNANWKFIGGDGYHAAFTHRSVRELLDARQDSGASAQDAPNGGEGERARAVASTFLDRARSNAVALGRGHVRLHDDNKHDAGITSLLSEAHVEPADEAAYKAAMQERYGDRYTDVIAESDPHIEVWPNLQLTSLHVRTVRPRAADRTEVDMAPALLRGVPHGINSARVRSHEWFFGPGSFGSPDDSEIFERIQRGMDATYRPQILMSRGLHREVQSDQGWTLGNRSDETTQRGQLSEWSAVMSGTGTAGD